MSSFKKKTVTNSTSTTTPNVADWLAQPYQNSASAVGDLMKNGPGAYTPTIDPALSRSWADGQNLRVPDYTGAKDAMGSAADYTGAKDAMGSAADYTGALNAMGPSADFTGATNAMGPEADFSGSKGLLDGVNYDLKGTSAADFMDRYRGMFSKDIINPVLEDYDQKAGQVRAAQAADGARNGAFGGGRFGLREGQTEGELARGRASTLGGLLKDAETFALTGASGDAGRTQSAQEGNRNARFTGASTLSGITAAEAANRNARTGLLTDIASRGSADRLARAGLTADVTGRAAADRLARAGLTADVTGRAAADRNARAGLLSDIASRQGADARSTLDLQNKFGAQATDLMNSIKQYPLAFQKQIQGLLSGLNPALFTGQTTTGSGTSTTSTSLAQVFADILTAAAASAAKGAVGG